MLTKRSVHFYYKNQTSSIDIFFCSLKNRKMVTPILKNSLALLKIQSRKAHIFIFSNDDFITYAD